MEGPRRLCSLGLGYGCLGELFKYQKEGVKWLKNKRFALLADDMGLGKSAQVVCAADENKAKTVLVVCPSSVRTKWKGEFLQWSNASRSIQVVKSGKEPEPTSDVVVMSYDLLKKYKLNRRFDLVVFDESHYLKNPKAKRTQLALGKNSPAMKCKHLIMVTGTPMPNNASELWIVLFLFGRTKLSYEAFVKKYCTTYFYNGRTNITGTKKATMGELKAMLKPIMLRRRKDQVQMQLPQLTYSNMLIEPCPLDFDDDRSFLEEYKIGPDREDAFYRDMEAERALLNETLERAEHRFRQKKIRKDSSPLSDNAHEILPSLAVNFAQLRRFMGHQKVEVAFQVVKQIVYEAKVTHREPHVKKVVVFCHHVSVLHALKRKFRNHGVDCVTLYGATNPDERDIAINKFNTRPSVKVFLGQIVAAGTGIDLTAANTALFVEQDWTPANNAQAIMRIHRIGQKNKCHVINLVLDDPVDMKIITALNRKVREIVGVLGGIPASIDQRTEAQTPAPHIPMVRKVKDKLVYREESIKRIIDRGDYDTKNVIKSRKAKGKP